MTATSTKKMNPLSLLRTHRFGLAATALCLLLALLVKPVHYGDFDEYAVTTAALASHGTPDVRPADVALAQRLLPDLAGLFQPLADGLAAQREIPKFGFQRARNGGVYAIHFFAYPALAALPFRVLQAAGADPFRCFLVVNFLCLAVLAVALRRQFGGTARALVALLLFLACGGFLYYRWSSPECMSAALLLAALMWTTAGRPVLAGALAGLAAMQNPPIVFFAAVAPLLQVAAAKHTTASWRSALAVLRAPGPWLGSVLCGLLFALPPVLSLIHFGTPSLIAKYSTSPALIGMPRLLSFFFDLNQGMLIGVPALLLAVAALGWNHAWRRDLLLLGLALLLTLMLAVPALSAGNWNSGANGMMRYAFWAAVPLLAALLWRLRAQARWPRLALTALILAQAYAMAAAQRYHYLEFSPLARWVLEHYPTAYHPDPEIFFERMTHVDSWGEPDRTYQYRDARGSVVKTLFNVRNSSFDTALCGPDRALDAASLVDAGQGWKYVDGTPRCLGTLTYTARDFGAAVAAGDGWTGVELGGGAWDGMWSNGARSRLQIKLAQPARAIQLVGHYFEQRRATRVTINGVDYGWMSLETGRWLPLAQALARDGQNLTIDLEHEAPYMPPAGQPDQRRIALFLQRIALQ